MAHNLVTNYGLLDKMDVFVRPRYPYFLPFAMNIPITVLEESQLMRSRYYFALWIGVGRGVAADASESGPDDKIPFGRVCGLSGEGLAGDGRRADGEWESM
jgi:hypothetical protein